MLNQPAEVLLLTSNSDLVFQVKRIAIPIGMTVHSTDNPFLVHVDWNTYRYILVGSDLAGECGEARLPRRSGIAIIHCDRDSGSEGTDWERELWKHAVTLGAANVVGLPSAEFWLRDVLSGLGHKNEQLSPLIAVTPGSGGAGASTLAVNLGLRAVSQGFSAVVIDSDPVGGGIDLTLGTEEVQGARWCDINPGSGRIATETLVSALPVFNGLSFLSHGRAGIHVPEPEVLAAVVDAGRRAFDVVIADIPRGLTPSSQLLISQSDLSVIVVRNHVRSVAASAGMNEWIRTVGGKSHFVVTADHKGVSVPDVARALGERDLTELPFIPSMTTRADEGEFPTMSHSYSQVCDHLLALSREVEKFKAA